MKTCVATLVLGILSLTAGAFASDSIIQDIRAIQVNHGPSTELLDFVIRHQFERLGYGLCSSAQRMGCERNSSLGYGLCAAAGLDGCQND